MTEKIGIIGAGNVGGNLGRRLAASGFEVRHGVRPRSDFGGSSAGPIPEVASWADIVFIAVPGPAVLDAVKSCGDLRGKIVVDCNNTLEWKDGPVYTPPREGSLAASIAAIAPGASVLKAFNTFGAEIHGDPSLAHGQNADVLIAGDDLKAKERLSAIASAAGFRPLDAGPLRNASLVESVAILWIHLAMKGGMGRENAFKFVGR